MKILLFLLGLLLTLFGLVICFGTIVGWTEKTSDYSLSTDIIGFVFIGVPPLVVGVGLLVTGIVLHLHERSAKERNDNPARPRSSSIGARNEPDC
jgi:hypothetical protein